MKYTNSAKKLVAAFCATAMVATLGAAPLAYADPSTSSNVTAAACRAAGMAPEILGIDGIEESGQFISDTTISSQSDLTAANLLGWNYPKYQLLGTDYNATANRFMYNLFNGGTPTILYNASRAGAGRGPNAALSISDSSDLAVLSMEPDIIVGTGISSNSDSAEDAVYANVLTGYSPKAITYSFSDNDEICDVMYDLADKADAIVRESYDEDTDSYSKTLRYDDPALDIALAYEKYIKGTKGLVLQAINNGATKKKVALVTAVNTVTDEDGNTSETYTIKKTGTTDGTANANRYLETCANVTENIADTLLASEGNTTDTTIDVTAAQLATANLVMIGGQTGSAPSVSDLPSAVQSRTYVLANNSAASGYGVTMNSVENAQNTGRILGILYPNVVNQANFIAYYFQTFYHIDVPASQNADGTTTYDYTNLKTVLVKALNGRVPKGTTDSSGTISVSYDWSASDFSSYSQSGVQTLIDSGCTYIQTQISSGASIPDELKPVAGSTFAVPDTSTN